MPAARTAASQTRCLETLMAMRNVIAKSNANQRMEEWMDVC